MKKRQTLSNIRNFFSDSEYDDPKKNEHVDVVVLLVSLKSSKNDSEIVLARNPVWDRLIKVIFL
jgi:hypothetical protein